MSPATRNVLIGKLVFIALFATITGYFIKRDVAADYEKGRTLTREAYVAAFEQHKVELMQQQYPVAVWVVGVGFLAFALFGVYELFGRGVGWVIGKVVREGAEIGGTPPMSRG